MSMPHASHCGAQYVLLETWHFTRIAEYLVLVVLFRTYLIYQQNYLRYFHSAFSRHHHAACVSCLAADLDGHHTWTLNSLVAFIGPRLTLLFVQVGSSHRQIWLRF